MSEGIILQKSASEGQIPESIEEKHVGRLKSRTDAKAGNNSKKSESICRWQTDYGISRELLEQQMFGKRLSRDDAAKTLGVSTSTLKRACRDLGISRWPNHNNKMPMPNSSLNQKLPVQSVKQHKGGSPPPLLLQPNIAMSVKVTYKDDTVRFPLSSSSSTMKYLEEQLERRFKIPVDNFSIKYQDEEDEWISVMCDSDLMYCMDVLRSCGKSVIRMRVTPKSVTLLPVECNPSSISTQQAVQLLK